MKINNIKSKKNGEYLESWDILVNGWSLGYKDGGTRGTGNKA